MTLTIGALNVYPIKSCRGVALQSAILTNAGLLYDREWMVVREDTGKFISQREKEALALVEISLPPEALTLPQPPGNTEAAAAAAAPLLPPQPPAGAVMTVTAPGMPPLQVPLQRRADCQIRQVTVWEWTGAGADEGEQAADWFSTYLGLPARLVRYLGSGGSRGGSGAGNSSGDSGSSGSSGRGAAGSRGQDAVEGSKGSGGGGGEGGVLPLVRTTEAAYAVDYETRFSDGYPMLLATQAALADLNSRLTEPLPMNRFRPNIEVAGSDPWAEDGWRDIEVRCSEDGRTLRLTSVKPCARCKMPTINQATGEVGDEPMDTLGVIRSGKQLGWNTGGNKAWTHCAFFGWNVVSRGTGVLRVGDVLTPVSTQMHPAALTPAM
ncbi:hypothetical protein Agub_g9520 [Astrephomene gubernaculifera]|uniref:MOSC domain-containing protein n=1 Tax=Astrephomene gubernaculifera TaxID=47775 RepID=A0AAD3DTG1_9CHLO|nr:hypothetical protein Agub_g9520 [Astrephomene gubernaculifera]